MKEEKNLEEKKHLVIGTICIGMAILSAIIFVFSLFNKKENELEQWNNTENNSNAESTENFSYEEFFDVEEIAAIEEISTENMNLEEDDWSGFISDEKPIVLDDFKITGLSKEQIDSVGGDISTLSQIIQETLYAHGYFGYTEAVSTGTVITDDAKTMITMNFDVTANENVNLDAVYYLNEDKWQINIW